jgi:NTP pyrophosphatase (non-canonical NTP hydrolase)
MSEDAFEKLVGDVIRWAEERRILVNTTPRDQFIKTVEEIGEIAHALATDNIDEFVDAVGDTLVTMILMTSSANVDVTYCLAHAYEQIKHRRGKMVNGVFVKEE